MASQFYPWQVSHRDRLQRLYANDKLPHALLLSGPAYLGKLEFARVMATLLLCRTPKDGQPCGECDGCRLVAAGTHPDFHMVTPEDSRLIRIEQIREVIDWVNQTAQRGGVKVVIVYPAEQMNASAANALLKCLEEPGDRTLFMLVSDQHGRLLPTIRSRCQLVNFTIPATRDALAWLAEQKPNLESPELLLAMAGGAPLAVLERYDDAFLERRAAIDKAMAGLLRGSNPLDAARVLTTEPGESLEVLHGLFADALRLALSDNENLIKNKDLESTVKACRVAMDRQALLAALDAVNRDQQAVAGPSNPNVQLLMEALMVEIADLCRL